MWETPHRPRRMQLTHRRRNKSPRDGKGQEATGGQQKEEKNIAQQEVQQKENRAESVDSHLLEFIIEADINTEFV